MTINIRQLRYAVMTADTQYASGRGRDVEQLGHPIGRRWFRRCSSSNSLMHLTPSSETCVDRLAGEGDHTINAEMAELEVQGHHHVAARTKGEEVEQAVVELRYKTIHVLPPIGKQKRHPALTLTVDPALCGAGLA